MVLNLSMSISSRHVVLPERARQLHAARQVVVERLAVEEARQRIDLALLARGLELVAQDAHLRAQRLDALVVGLAPLLDDLAELDDGRQHLALQLAGRRALRQLLQPTELLLDAAVGVLLGANE